MQQKTQLFKGSLTTIILKLLSEQEKMYGYEITKKVKELSAGSFTLTEGALYPSLHKLEAEGLLTASIQQIDNRQRKYYSITTSGKKEMKVKMSEVTSFINQLQSLLQLKLTHK
jgi:DNA-binding PadR family transcriptional regulator